MPNLLLSSHFKWTILNRLVTVGGLECIKKKINIHPVADCLFWRLCSSAVSYVCCTFPCLGKWCFYGSNSHLCLGIRVSVAFLLQLQCNLQYCSAVCREGGCDSLLHWGVLVRTPGTRALFVVNRNCFILPTVHIVLSELPAPSRPIVMKDVNVRATV